MEDLQFFTLYTSVNFDQFFVINVLYLSSMNNNSISIFGGGTQMKWRKETFAIILDLLNIPSRQIIRINKELEDSRFCS